MSEQITIRLLRFVACAILLLGTVSAFCNQNVNLDSQPAISLSINSVEQVVTSGSPIQVKVTMKNISDHKVLYWRENAPHPADHEYIVEVSDAKSVRPPDTKFGQVMRVQHDPTFMPDAPRGTRSGGWQPLNPTDSLVDELNVSELYDLSRAGKYTIQVERFDDYSKALVKSNKITMTVKQ